MGENNCCCAIDYAKGYSYFPYTSLPNTTSLNGLYKINSVVIKELEKEKNKKVDTNKFFGRVSEGLCRLSINGDMAVKTSNGYKTYDVKTGVLTNCDNFVFDIGDEFFFIVPTNKVEAGDVILSAGKPHCVIKVESNRIEAFRYEDGNIVTIVPERTMFMGKTYFYGKIVSMLGDIKHKGANKVMKYMMLSQMMKNKDNSLIPMMMFLGKDGNFFDELFEEEEIEG